MSSLTDFTDKLESLFGSSKYENSNPKMVADDIKTATENYLKNRKVSYATPVAGTYNGSEAFVGSFSFSEVDYSAAINSAYPTLLSEITAIPSKSSVSMNSLFTNAIDHFFTTVLSLTQIKGKFSGTATISGLPPVTHPAVFDSTLCTIVQSTVSVEAAAMVPKLDDMLPQPKERSESDPNYPCKIETEEEVCNRLGANSFLEYLCKLIGQVLDNGFMKAVITVSSVGSNNAVASPCIPS